MNGSTSNVLQDEAGASDNRLELNPNEEAVKDMKNGETRRLSMDVTQVESGSYTCAEIEKCGAEEEKEEPGTEVQPEAEPNEVDKESADEYPNPAVAKMMAGEKR